MRSSTIYSCAFSTLTSSISELQPDHPERVPSRRAPNPHHNPPRQSNHPLHARLANDRLLQHPTHQHCQQLHHHNLLDLFRRHNGTQFYFPDDFWRAE